MGGPIVGVLPLPTAIPIDNVKLPDRYSWGAMGGPMFNTQVTAGTNNREQRVIGWQAPLHKWNLAFTVQNDAQLLELLGFFRARQGRARGFRFKDWIDYQINPGDHTVAGGFDYKTYRYADPMQAFTAFFKRKIINVFDPGTGILEFEVPVMFDKDDMPVTMEQWQSSSWPLGLQEIRL